MADKTLKLSESRDLIKVLIGDPDGDGLTNAQIDTIYNMTYQRYHGEHIRNQVASLRDTSNNMPKTAYENPVVNIRFNTSTTIRRILRCEMVTGVGPNVMMERVELPELMRRLNADATLGDPTAFCALKDPSTNYNAWNFWFHPRPNGLYTFEPYGETSPVDLAADEAQPQGVTPAESIAITHVAAYHCAMLLNQRERMQQIIQTMPQTDRLRFNLRESQTRPQVRPNEAHI